MCKAVISVLSSLSLSSPVLRPCCSRHNIFQARKGVCVLCLWIGRPSSTPQIYNLSAQLMESRRYYLYTPYKPWWNNRLWMRENKVKIRPHLFRLGIFVLLSLIFFILDLVIPAKRSCFTENNGSYCSYRSNCSYGSYCIKHIFFSFRYRIVVN